MASSAFSNSVSRWKYEVFLSFRGEDTRKSFTDHLYNALDRAGINTFRDDDELPRGEEIGPELLKSIKESRFSIIVLSKNYASSTWCLDELVHILACRETLGHAVFPVFYDIDPADVRKQQGSFAEAFDRHEEQFKYDKDKVKRWRAALTEVANLKGLDLRNEANGHESKNIDSIVKEISNRLNRSKLRDATVGLHSRADKVSMQPPTNELLKLVIHNMITGQPNDTDVIKNSTVTYQRFPLAPAAENMDAGETEDAKNKKKKAVEYNDGQNDDDSGEEESDDAERESDDEDEDDDNVDGECGDEDYDDDDDDDDDEDDAEGESDDEDEEDDNADGECGDEDYDDDDDDDDDDDFEEDDDDEDYDLVRFSEC